MSGLGPRTAPTYNGSMPNNYVAGGIGRGAQGFTTRSDIGPARAAAPAAGTAAPGLAGPVVPGGTFTPSSVGADGWLAVQFGRTSSPAN